MAGLLIVARYTNGRSAKLSLSDTSTYAQLLEAVDHALDLKLTPGGGGGVASLRLLHGFPPRDLSLKLSPDDTIGATLKNMDSIKVRGAWSVVRGGQMGNSTARAAGPGRGGVGSPRRH